MRGVWKFWLPTLFLLVGALYMVSLTVRAPDSRLYWEFGGRIDHRSFTQGYLEWTHHRAGDPLPLESAKRASHALAPYTDFSSEYPAGALLVFAAVRLAFDDVRIFTIAYSSLVTICVCVSISLIMLLVERHFSNARTQTLVAFTFMMWVGLSGAFVVTRFDSIVAGFVTLGLFAWYGGRYFLTGVCLGLGASIKLWPALLIPLCGAANLHHFRSQPEAGRQVLSLGIGGLVGVTLPCVAVVAFGTSPNDLFAYLAYYRDRPIEIESLLANIVMILHSMGLLTVQENFDFGSINLLPANWSLMAQFFSISFGLLWFGTVFWIWRSGASKEATIYAMGFVVVALMLASKVFSGEYMIWIMPFALLAVAQGRWGSAVAYSVALAFLKLAFWHWDSVREMELVGILLLTFKNLACIVTAYLFAYEMRQAIRSGGAGKRLGTTADETT